MKFDINKEFSFSQIGAAFKDKFGAFMGFISRLDNSSIKTVKIKNRSVRINALRLGFIAAVLAAMVALFINLVVIPNTTYRAYSGIEFDTGGDYIRHAFGDDILLLNNSGLRMVDNKGRNVWQIDATFTCPTVDIAGNYALVADLDGNNTLTLYNRDGETVTSYEISTDILAAKVNKRGIAAAAINEEGYMGSAVVYDRNGNEIFKWNSGEGYIIDVDISNDGRSVAVAQMMSDGTEAYSRIHILNISNGEETAGFVCDGDLVAKVCFDSSDNLTAIAQDCVYNITKRGRENFKIDLAGKSASEYDVENGDYLLFLCSDSRGNSMLEIYSKRGKYLGSYVSADTINNIAAFEKNIVVSTSRDVLSLSRKGKVRKTINISHDIMSIGIYGNGRNVLVLGGYTADIVRIK